MPARNSEEPTVFVVDDNEAMRDALRAAVEIEGMQVECYGSAREFLENHDGSRRGCLVADIRMPGMSGVELHEQLVRGGAAPPTIFITGHATPQVTEKDRAQGVVGAFRKPFAPEKLLALIGRVIEQQRGE